MVLNSSWLFSVLSFRGQNSVQLPAVSARQMRSLTRTRKNRLASPVAGMSSTKFYAERQQCSDPPPPVSAFRQHRADPPPCRLMLFLDAPLGAILHGSPRLRSPQLLLPIFMCLSDVYECLLRHSNAEKTGGARKDILVQLKKILREQYAANPDSRTLIFVATRAAARNLCEYLNSVHEELEFGEKEVGYVTSKHCRGRGRPPHLRSR